jgi:hypothetical protein
VKSSCRLPVASCQWSSRWFYWQLATGSWRLTL